MAVTLSTRLEPGSREMLLGTAASAIEARLAGTAGSLPPTAGLPEELLAERATFVTLTIEDELRGCCGTLEPRRALALDVWHNAQVSAFNDPRFPPLEFREWVRVDLEISVLSPLERMYVHGEAELLRQVVPGEDGLVIAWRGSRATFLPKVWNQIDDPRDFLRRLKIKAGWTAGFWDPDVEVWRYRTETMAVRRPAGVRTAASA